MSAAGNLAGGGLGNKASALALQRVGGSAAGRVGAQVAGAGTMGGVSNATQQAGEVIDHHLNSNQLGRESISLQEVGTTTVVSGALGPALAPVAKAIDGAFGKVPGAVENLVSRVLPKR